VSLGVFQHQEGHTNILIIPLNCHRAPTQALKACSETHPGGEVRSACVFHLPTIACFDWVLCDVTIM